MRCGSTDTILGIGTGVTFTKFLGVCSVTETDALGRAIDMDVEGAVSNTEDGGGFTIIVTNK